MRPTSSQNGGTFGPQTTGLGGAPGGDQFGMQSGGQTGGQGGGQTGPQMGGQGVQQSGGQQSGGQQASGQNGAQAGGPPSVEQISSWLDEVIADGGFTMTTSQSKQLEHVAEEIDETLASNGAELPEEYTRHLESTIRDLRGIATNGDRATTGKESSLFPTAMAKAVHKLDEFLEYEGANLSTEANSRLQSALTTMESVYADGTVSTAEKTSVSSAADTICDVLLDDFTKLSDVGLDALEFEATNLDTLLSTSFLAYDDTQRALVFGANETLDAMTTKDVAVIHEVTDDLRFGLGGYILNLAKPAVASEQSAMFNLTGTDQNASAGVEMYI